MPKGTTMKAMAKIAALTVFLGSVAIGASAPVGAQYYYYPHHYWPGYGYGYGYGYYNPNPNCTYAGCCPRGFTVQGGVCKPYQGPVGPGPEWSYYHHRRY